MIQALDDVLKKNWAGWFGGEVPRRLNYLKMNGRLSGETEVNFLIFTPQERQPRLVVRISSSAAGSREIQQEYAVLRTLENQNLGLIEIPRAYWCGPLVDGWQASICSAPKGFPMHDLPRLGTSLDSPRIRRLVKRQVEAALDWLGRFQQATAQVRAGISPGEIEALFRLSALPPRSAAGLPADLEALLQPILQKLVPALASTPLRLVCEHGNYRAGSIYTDGRVTGVINWQEAAFNRLPILDAPAFITGYLSAALSAEGEVKGEIDGLLSQHSWFADTVLPRLQAYFQQVGLPQIDPQLLIGLALIREAMGEQLNGQTGGDFQPMLEAWAAGMAGKQGLRPYRNQGKIKAMLNQTHLYEEIHEQPVVLEKLLTNETAPVRRLADAILQRQVDHVVIAARGTSDNAGRYAQYLLGAMNRLVVALATPSLFSIYKKPPRLGNALVLGISQSGKSPDIIAVLAEARRQGALTVAITNSPGSDITHEADHVIELHAGLEQSVAATKTYTCELLAIALLSASLSGDMQLMNELQKIPAVADATLKMEAHIEEMVQRYRYMRECVVLGRGYNYATAFELALKMKELTYTFVEAYSSADFLHGPLAVIEYGFPAITIAPSGVMLPEIQAFMPTLKERGAETIVISDDDATLGMADIPLRLPAPVPEWLSPIPTILPGQLFVMHLAHIRNIDPDKPRAIHKITETL